MYLFEDTDFEYVPNDKQCRVVVDTYFTTDCFTDWTYHDHTLIQDFCVEDYGLTKDEVIYVWREYNEMIYDKVREIISINRNINESVDNTNYLQKVVSIMKPPYIEDLKMFEIPTEKWEEVFSLLFKRDINSIELGRSIERDATILFIDKPLKFYKPLYVEWDNGSWILRDYDDNGNLLYNENSDGEWQKWEYDNNKICTYYENSDGYLDDYSENSLNESVDKYYSLSKLLNPPYFRDLISLEIPQKEWDNIFKHIFKNKDIYVLYIGSEDPDVDAGVIVDRDSKFFIYREMGNGDYRFGKSYDVENSLNESVGDKENMVIDKIVNFMLEDTNYKIKTIKGDPVARIIYPFYDEIYTEEWDSIDYQLNYMGDYPLNVSEVKYISNQYGITDTSFILEIFNRYIRILFTKLREEIENKMEDDSLNESVDTNNKFLDKVVESLIGDTKINTKLAIILYPPINFYSSHMSLLLPSEKFYDEFADYCNKHYGITPEEFDIVWGKYSQIMFNKFDVSDNILKESDDRRKNYLDKVLEFILSDTIIESSSMGKQWVNIFVPFTKLVYSRIMHFDREDFFDYCRDTYGLTKYESYSVWEDYINEVNQILINEWGVKDPIYH